MKIISDSVTISAEGFNDMKDLTPMVSQKLAASRLKDGLVNIFIPGSTAGLTTIEFEPGLVEDFSRLMEKIAPDNIPYNHDKRWGDGNGFSHVRASLIGPSLTVPFSGGQLNLGTWQQIVFVDFDNGPRTRTILFQFLGE
ncbi:MAG: secondary thiamine-phosphate synthase enzyme YjbQ [Candidatus Aminicenantes bacterium]|jgi:secondary thiamine-phosphate synthase enzyme|nr:secondary thiamine-phosphate synthase enzyme YjbQ [Candidatus Aminicenantes bacterium]